MAYRFIKSTVVLGYDTAEANPFSRAVLGESRTPDQLMQSYAWSERHMKSYSLSGHWSAEAIKRYADRRQLHRVAATHHENNVSKPGVLNSHRPVAL